MIQNYKCKQKKQKKNESTLVLKKKEKTQRKKKLSSQDFIIPSLIILSFKIKYYHFRNFLIPRKLN